MKKLLFPLLCLCTLWATAQDGSRKILRGAVTSTTEDVVGVVVQNISSEDAVITDIDGNFTIRVQVNDTLDSSGAVAAPDVSGAGYSAWGQEDVHAKFESLQSPPRVDIQAEMMS